MTAHTKEEFDLFMSQLATTNATLSFYSDFKKIAKNTADIAISLNSLNYLIGQENLRDAVEALWKRDKRVFDVMDILIATREKDKKMFLDDLGTPHPIHSLFEDVDGIMKFLTGTGLAEVIRKREIKDLVDYVFGVETGLDTNARKNRSGDTMQYVVAKILNHAHIKFQSQVSSTCFPDIASQLGKDNKVFDFVIKKPLKTFLIEVNFYSGGGSKLNEVARSYTDIAQKINGTKGYEFVWVTDGMGWHDAKNNLEEAYYAIPKVFNLRNLQGFINEITCDSVC